MDREKRKRLEAQLRRLELQRAGVQAMDTALAKLTPEERLVVQKLLITPQRGNSTVLCDLLQMELSSVYRRKDRALDKLALALGPGEP